MAFLVHNFGVRKPTLLFQLLKNWCISLIVRESMKLLAMNREPTGAYHTTATAGEHVRSFVPLSLPPVPVLEITGERQLLLERATLAVGRLDSISTLLPDPHLFLYSYVRREAVLSSQIEGTQSSLSDLLLFELEEVPGTPFDDVVEVSK